MKKKLICFLFLILTYSFLIAELDIPRLDRDDLVDMLVADVKNSNNISRSLNEDTLLIDTSGITDSLLYNYLKERLFRENLKSFNFPKILNDDFYIYEQFIYKDILYFYSDPDDSLTILTTENPDSFDELNYYYFKGPKKPVINLFLLNMIGGNWKFCNSESIEFVYNNKDMIFDWLSSEKLKMRIRDSETFPPFILCKNAPVKLYLENINRYRFPIDNNKLEFSYGFIVLERDSSSYLFPLSDFSFLEILDSKFALLDISADSIAILNSDIEKLNISAKEDIKLKDNVIDNFSIILFPPFVEIDSNIFMDYVHLTKSNSKRIESIILENNIFTMGLNFDWHSLKELNVSVSDGPNRAERMQRMYSMLKNNLKRVNRLEDADDCHYVSRDYLRKNYWKDSGTDFITRTFKSLFYFVDWISTGYGTKPLRIFPYALLVILIFSVIYYLNPESINNLHEHIEFNDVLRHKLNKFSFDDLKKKFADKIDEDVSLNKHQYIEEIIYSLNSKEIAKFAGILLIKGKLKQFWNCFYFSFSTFTTIGVGDWYPRNSFTKLLVMIEGALGWISLGLFITSYGNLLLR